MTIKESIEQSKKIEALKEYIRQNFGLTHYYTYESRKEDNKDGVEHYFQVRIKLK